MVEIGKFIEFLKLQLPVLTAFALALGVFIFMPDKAAGQMGIEKVRVDYKSYASCAFLITGSLVMVQTSVIVFKHFSKKCKARAWLKAAKERLENLSIAEKQILCGFILTGEKTQYLSVQDGNVNGLCQAQIIYRSAQLGDLNGKGFAHSIQPWAWEYLNKHRELITEGVPTDAQGRVILYDNPFNLFGRMMRW